MSGDAASASAAAPPAILCVGIATHDFIFSVPQMPREPTKYRSRDLVSIGGGCAGNAAVAIARLGGRALLACRLGDDLVGAMMVDELSGEGVDCAMVGRLPGRTSPVSAVLVDGQGERIIVCHSDPNMPAEAGAFALPQGLAAVLSDIWWPEAGRRAFAMAKRAGVLTVLDGELPGPPHDLVAAADIVAFSRGGLRASMGEDSIEAGLRKAATIGAGRMICTDGANGVFWLEGAALRHLPAFAVPAKDTLGAGDCWHGALALALAEGRALDQALLFASAAAALKVRTFGGRAGMPTRAATDEFLAAQSDATLGKERS